jgi:hypothetical protein
MLNLHYFVNIVGTTRQNVFRNLSYATNCFIKQKSHVWSFFSCIKQVAKENSTFNVGFLIGD